MQKILKDNISNAVFYVPFTYLYTVRLGSVWKLLSWALIYLMPTLFYSYLAAKQVNWFVMPGHTSLFIVNYVLILVSTFTLYEFGYILNDTVAIYDEKDPSIRLPKENIDFFYNHYISILVTRMSITCIALLAFGILNSDYYYQCVSTVICTILVMLLFFIYNAWRNKWNVLFYPILVFSRYLPFLLLYNPSWLIVLLLFLSFPLCNWLERFSMPRYRFAFMRRLIPSEQSKPMFRVFYYIVLRLVLFVVFYYAQLPTTWLLPIDALLTYRLILLLFGRYFKFKNYLNG